MKPSKMSRWVLFQFHLVVTGCGSPNAPSVDKSFDVVLHALSDEGQPVEGVQFSCAELALGTTDTKGKVAMQLRGVDGQILAVTTTCPDGYLAPEQPAQLRLAEVRKLDPTAPAAIGFDSVCTRKVRDVVLVVRTSQAPVLKVEVAGKSVGSTDGNGQAHFRFQLDRTVSRMSVSLDTTATPMLRPQNPSRVFELDGQDAVLLLDQSFTVERTLPVKRHVVVAKKREEPERHIPYRIDSGRNHAF